VNGGAKNIRDELQDAFGLFEGPIDTGTVLLTPSSVLRAQAVDIAKRCPLKGVLRDLGALAAGAISLEMEASGLRVADYADQNEVAGILLERVSQLLLDEEGEFARSVRDHLRLRG